MPATKINFVDSPTMIWNGGAPYVDPSDPQGPQIRDMTGLAVGAGIVWQGAWSGATAYVANDAVSYNGSSYICILGHTNHVPPNATYWNVIASYLPPSRSTAAVTTGTLATDASESGSFAVGKSFYLLEITFSCKARVTLYSTAAKQSADSARTWGNQPVEYTEHGVITDVQVVDGSFPVTRLMSPAAVGFNGDGPATTDIYYKITNKDSSQAVTITLTVLPLET